MKTTHKKTAIIAAFSLSMLCGCATVGGLRSAQKDVTIIDISANKLPKENNSMIGNIVSAITKPFENIFNGVATNTTSALDKIAGAIFNATNYVGAERLIKSDQAGIRIITNGQIDMENIDASIVNEPTKTEKSNKIFKVTFDKLTITKNLQE